MPDSPDIEKLDSFYNEVIANFTGLLTSFNYKEDIQLLGISKFNFCQRKNMVMELEGLYVALWNMALSQSFPNDYVFILDKFMETELPKRCSKNQLPLQKKRIKDYVELIDTNTDTSFAPVSHHILSLLQTEEDQFRSMNLKIALHIRSVYKYIFDRLF